MNRIKRLHIWGKTSENPRKKKKSSEVLLQSKKKQKTPVKNDDDNVEVRRPIPDTKLRRYITIQLLMFGDTRFDHLS